MSIVVLCTLYSPKNQEYSVIVYMVLYSPRNQEYSRIVYILQLGESWVY
jgi:hypothetical protein